MPHPVYYKLKAHLHDSLIQYTNEFGRFDKYLKLANVS